MIRPLKIDTMQFGAKVGRHMVEFGRDPNNAAHRQWLFAHIKQIYECPLQMREGTFSGQGQPLPGGHARGNVWFYADSHDVVVTDHEDNFVTILKDGVIASTSFKLAKVLRARPSCPAAVNSNSWKGVVQLIRGVCYPRLGGGHVDVDF